MRACAWWLLVILLSTSLHSASADDASESRTRRELGQEYYRQGRYQEALDMFLEAYRLVPMPTLAYDVAQTYGLLARPIQSFNWYQTFLIASEGDERLATGRSQATSAVEGLSARVAVLQLTSAPLGAEVFVDRVELGSWGATPRALAVPEGPHTLVFRAPGHHESRADVVATIGRVEMVSVDLAPILGSVAITTEPTGATILDARTQAVLGTAPLTISVPVGELRVRTMLAGWVDVERTLDVVEGGVAHLAIPLAREASTVAVLSVEGEPPGASVSVDGRSVGAMPMTIDTLSVGTHTVTVEHAGLERVARDVVLEAGGATRLAVSLRPPEPWEWPTWRWLAYALGGATVLGGALAGTLALVGRDDFFADPTRGRLDAQRDMITAADALFVTGAVLLGLTLALDLALQPPQHSTAEVTLDR